MAKLYQFQQLIHTLHYLSAIELLPVGKEGSKPCLETLLLQGIANGTFPDDQVAAQHLYQASASDPRYTVLKSRLKNRLFNSLLHSNLEDITAVRPLDQYHLCDTNLLRAKRLLQLGQTQLAEKLINQVWKTSQDYEFTVLTIACLELKSQLYIQASNRIGYQENQTLLGRYRTLLHAEQLAQALYEQVQWQSQADISPYGQVSEPLNQVVTQLQTLWEGNNSYICFEYFYKLRIWQLEKYGSYEQLLAFTKQASLPSNQTGINSKRFDRQANHAVLLMAYLRIGKWVEGIEIAQDYLPLLDATLPTWWQFQENYFLLMVQAGQYQEALKTRQVAEQRTMKQSAEESEKWTLYKAYIYWVTDSCLFQSTYLLLQTSLSLHVDKRGYNISLIILEFIYLMQLNQTDKLIEKATQYRKYMERYLNHPKKKREWLFFKLMLLTINLNFNYNSIHKYSPKLLEKLNEYTSPDGTFNYKVEVILYGQVWDKIMTILHSHKKIFKY